jgi:hypothetical protein
MIGVVNLAHEAGDDVDARLQGELLGFDLVAHGGDRLGGRSDEGDIVLGAGLGETLALGEEAIAGMNCIRPGRLARRNDLVRDQIGLRSGRRADVNRLVRHQHMRRARVSVRIYRNGRDAHLPRGADDTASDFAAICDQDFGDCHRYSCPSPIPTAHSGG